jgi:hypothetical protein
MRCSTCRYRATAVCKTCCARLPVPTADFSVVICSDISRCARDSFYGLKLEKDLEALGIPLPAPTPSTRSALPAWRRASRQPTRPSGGSSVRSSPCPTMTSWPRPCAPISASATTRIRHAHRTPGSAVIRPFPLLPPPSPHARGREISA